ncbi:MAG: glycosyltransferase family 4 protein [Saprospiraceae bacterium]
MKIIFIHQDGLLTGSAFSMLNLIKGFKGKVEIHVVLADDGPYRKLLNDEGIESSICSFSRFWTFPGPKWYQRRAFFQLNALFINPQIKKHILNLQPDIIHLNDKACLQAGLSLKDSHIPIIQHLRSSYYPTNSWILKNLSNRSIKAYASALIAISEDEADGFDGDRRLSVIFNTVSMQHAEEAIRLRVMKRTELGIGSGELVIGYAANLTKIKGAWDFLQMAIALCQRCPDNKFRFVMVGNLPKTPKNPGRLVRWGIRKAEDPCITLERYQAEPLLQGKLEILGFRNDILPLIAAMDILVVCTRLGVLGRQPFEAMAVKTPVVVASGHTRKSRIILHEKTGLVAPMKDLPGLIHAVDRLAADSVLRQTLSENGFEYARTSFNPEINSRKVLDLYNNLLKKRPHPTSLYGSEV